MNLATLVQSQTLATLLQALSPTTGLAPGRTVEARLLTLAGDGTATAQLGDDTVTLMLAGPTARQNALQPGATLVLRFDAAEEAGTNLRATLVDVRAPAAQETQPGAVPAAVSIPQPGTAAQIAAAASASIPSGQSTSAPAPAGSTPLPAAVLAATQPSAVKVGTQAATGSNTSQQQAWPQTATPQAAAPATPRALAGALLGPALARQDSLAPLLANMQALAEGSVSLALPKPILTLVERVLAQAVPVERRPLTGQALRTAVQNSGLFLEASRAEGRPLPPGGDLKAGLQALRDGLAPLAQALSPPRATAPTAARNPGAEAAQHAPMPGLPSRPSPPQRDGALHPQPPAAPSLSAGETPLAIVETLLEQAEAGLDRIKLAQYASLPPEAARVEAQQAQQGQRWLTEIPLAFHHGTAMLPLQIEREPPRRDGSDASGPLWRVRFALDVEPIGPLQGVVTLQGRSVGISLWAEREETSKLLRGASPQLEAALAGAQFESGGIDIRTGQPRTVQPTAGQFLDRMS
ncbi:hypothetical protein ASE63_09970 [Bosea sp. Root381]|uniref:flagellar hook-length control protein FliK n=1 Tax=Bosea sp. Root381 TaxID=1736524 RepID=UPI0006FC1CA9|nr:flagellar hook-length control protein FliK [Bosea sp. Root381]KRE00379.1 hypothetical protein ASE63_09970 [Bosea sp. Root381]